MMWLFMSAPKETLSVAASPKVRFPLMVALPVTVRSPPIVASSVTERSSPMYTVRPKCPSLHCFVVLPKSIKLSNLGNTALASTSNSLDAPSFNIGAPPPVVPSWL